MPTTANVQTRTIRFTITVNQPRCCATRRDNAASPRKSAHPRQGSGLWSESGRLGFVPGSVRR